MGLLATAMGLEPGKEGMKELTKRMKQGKIGMDELFKFLDMAAGRARSTGAYDLAINSKQAFETRMSNSYKEFSMSFMSLFDNQIKGTFSSLTTTLENLNKTMQDAKNEETLRGGIVGDKKLQFEYILHIFKTAGEGLMLGVESMYEFAKMIMPSLRNAGTMNEALADREIKDKYFQAKGARTPSEKAGLEGAGFPGIDAIIAKHVAAVGGDLYYQQMYLDSFRQRNPIPTDPGNLMRKPGSKLYIPAPMFEDMKINDLQRNFTPNITVMIDGYAIPKDSIDAQIANAFGRVAKPL